MKALLWNRPGAVADFGGDTLQWLRTSEELVALGVEVERSDAAQPDLAGYDLVHLFNLQSDEAALPVAEAARAAGLPIALSTIWWDLSEGRYLRRLRRKLSLRAREALVGRERSLARFRARDEATPAARARRLRVRRLLELADVLLPNSAAELELLAEHFALPELRRKTAVVPNAVDPPAAPAEGERAGVLCVGKLHPLKNQLGLIEALTGLDAPLTLIGDDRRHPDYVQACRAAAARHGRCQLLGPLPHAELAEHYARAQVHALVSFRETPGLVSLEAAALGCAVVSTDRGSAGEYFGEQAELTDPSDPAAVRAAVERALREPRRVSPELLARFTWRRAAEVTQQAYRFVLGEALELPLTL